MKLTFIGATGTVTGSKYLIEFDNGKKILVDCGLFQGLKDLRLRNWADLPFDPSSIDAVLLTHAHIDHSGYLPLLIKNGFKGPVYATKATRELCSVLLPDSGHLHEEDAKRANKYGYSKHHPALPLYTEKDGEQALKHFVDVEYQQPNAILDVCKATWHRAGHILGSSFIQLEANGVKLLFTGDIGRQVDPVMKPSALIDETDYLVLESTYGNRLHEEADPEDLLADVINATAKRGGTVLIPAFAVGRSQNLLYHIYRLKQQKRIPDLPVFLDSPMAIDATEIFLNNKAEHKLTAEECREVNKLVQYVNTVEESKAIDNIAMPKVIISASGMMTGGRVLHHLKIFVTEPKNTIVLSGYQAAGTRGDRILRGEKQLKIHGQMYPVRAQVEVLTNISAHADYQEILRWLKHFKKPPEKLFITHGEPKASKALKEHIERELGWNCVIPGYLEQFNI